MELAGLFCGLYGIRFSRTLKFALEGKGTFLFLLWRNYLSNVTLFSGINV